MYIMHIPACRFLLGGGGGGGMPFPLCTYQIALTANSSLFQSFDECGIISGVLWNLAVLCTCTQ